MTVTKTQIKLVSFLDGSGQYKQNKSDTQKRSQSVFPSCEDQNFHPNRSLVMSIFPENSP